MENKGTVFEIKRFAVHDGDGIRTTVFFKGCPLKCVWCHNPEGIDYNPQLSYFPDKCANCGECVKSCPNGAQIFENGKHIFHRELCKGCGKCAEYCISNALLFYGKKFTVSEIMPILLEDREFYENSGGSVTLSGGECLMQADFCAELLKELKSQGIHTAVDTCGFVPKESIEKVIDYTDVFLYDIKAFDSVIHKKCTGQPNDLIFENLKYIDSRNKKIEIRIPFVPEFNENEIEKISAFLSDFKNILSVKVLPYHNYAGSKYKSLGLENTLPTHLPTEEQINNARKFFETL